MGHGSHMCYSLGIFLFGIDVYARCWMAVILEYGTLYTVDLLFDQASDINFGILLSGAH